MSVTSLTAVLDVAFGTTVNDADTSAEWLPDIHRWNMAKKEN
jgi:hypothetical protein